MFDRMNKDLSEVASLRDDCLRNSRHRTITEFASENSIWKGDFCHLGREIWATASCFRELLSTEYHGIWFFISR
jgi:hypothetical protein